jgi:hypothetical protein
VVEQGQQSVRIGFAVMGVLMLVLATMVVRTYQTTQRLSAEVDRLEAELAAAPEDAVAGDDAESGPLRQLLEEGVTAEELLRELGSAENREALEGLLSDQGLLDGGGLDGLFDRDVLEGLLDGEGLGALRGRAGDLDR